MLLPSLGDGFFNDANPTIIPLSESPGLIFAGSFEGGTGLDIVALDPGTGDVTLISGLSTGSPTSQIFSSGGLDPVAAFAVPGRTASRISSSPTTPMGEWRCWREARTD